MGWVQSGNSSGLGSSPPPKILAPPPRAVDSLVSRAIGLYTKIGGAGRGAWAAAAAVGAGRQGVAGRREGRRAVAVGWAEGGRLQVR